MEPRGRTAPWGPAGGQEPPVPGYWNPAQPRAFGFGRFPGGADAQERQGMDSPYTNGSYTAPYPPAAPHYTALPQTRTYSCSGPSYSTDSTAPYRPPPPAPPWGCGTQDCPAEGCSQRRQQPAGYSPPQTPGMPVPQYPYGDHSPGVNPQPRAQEEAWAPPTYGVQPQYAWPTAPAHGNPFLTESQPPWTCSGAASHPPAWDSKESAYNKPEQSANQHSYYSEGNHQHSGTVNDHKPPTLLNAKSSPSNPKVQYSAQPQMYNSTTRRQLAGNQEAGCKAGNHTSMNSAAIQPEIQRILHVTEQAEQLEQEVDEFVGKKTDKSYRLLEEMLTKLLLELDSIETGGQDSVRQARKEAVHRIQAILEKLERKGL
ncbi:LOW QUALITY PROTEIN: BAG family molecular chaperone regulator 4 [Lagopus leucura]|uniref:LOW QUALITY PROTEIN: BAG family molecular chaperone regulator 4 n=1 Tax=Lagopus leucura TaxID=30410 RepID=UPI001C685851|nr:LOW QUALITY PROTEIN: BAG family molecular chaperone regulator 4 [Lagopus leucura]